MAQHGPARRRSWLPSPRRGSGTVPGSHFGRPRPRPAAGIASGSRGSPVPAACSTARHTRASSLASPPVTASIFSCCSDSGAVAWQKPADSARAVGGGGAYRVGETPPISRRRRTPWCRRRAKRVQGLTHGQDLLDHDPGLGPLHQIPQPGQIAGRVGQPVGMIHPHPVDESLRKNQRATAGDWLRTPPGPPGAARPVR